MARKAQGRKTGIVKRLPSATRDFGVIRSDDGTAFEFKTKKNIMVGIGVTFIDDGQGMARDIQISKRSHRTAVFRDFS